MYARGHKNAFSQVIEIHTSPISVMHTYSVDLEGRFHFILVWPTLKQMFKSHIFWETLQSI